MKSQKTNAFQLAVAGGVLVLVLVCATFAWFAAGDFSFIRGILAGMTPHEIPTQINQVEYSPTGGSDATDWAVYNGSMLDIEPGQTHHFRVKFTALGTDVFTLNLNNIDSSYRAPAPDPEIQEGEESSAESIILPPADEPAKLAGLLQYSVNGSEFKQIVIDSSTNRTAVLGDVAAPYKVSDMYYENGQYICYYDIKMVGGAENVNYKEYMNLQLSFDLEMPFQSTIAS